ncbi:MAG: hypothetical protein JW818_21635 [Pirellulales bacterium]|nr:hypothetical protein [Pirellulales bacterium]
MQSVYVDIRLTMWWETISKPLTTPTSRSFWSWLLVLNLLVATGCTHAQLRRSAVHHSMTLSDIYTQQVLNNLAMFVDNPDALPFFAYPNQGTTEIQDHGAMGNLGYSSPNFSSSPFMVNASRATIENWLLVPVTNPAKLALMRCAYRDAISSCVSIDTCCPVDCPDCKKLREQFYGPGDARRGTGSPQPCLASSCWFCWGCKRHVPKTCHRPYVGTYGNVAVWVPPEGRDMLTRLTLTILDYAVNDPVQFSKRTKEVEYSLKVNKDGTTSYDADGSIKIKATIPIDEPATLLKTLGSSKDISEFLSSFDRGIAEKVKQFVDENKPGDATREKYWESISKDSSELPADIQKPIEFLKSRKLQPWDIPNDALVREPILLKRTGSASEGLQYWEQRLRAASPSTSR